MRYLERLARSRGVVRTLAYYHPNWRRDAAPLLDELGASVDHVEAHSKGGSSDIRNLATICAKCNARKGSLAADAHLKRHPLKKVKGKHGEPVDWDGLATVFVLLVDENPTVATPTEKLWAAALKQVWAPIMGSTRS
jgi:hypothetical protein